MPTPAPVLDGEGRGHCPQCRAAVVLKGPSTGGMHPGKYYVHCVACHYHYTYHHTNDLSEGARNAAHARSRLSKSASPRPPSTAPVPDPTQPTPTAHTSGTQEGTNKRRKCSRPSCNRQGNKNCSTYGCQQCCIDSGGCTGVRSHIGKAQSSSAMPPPPPPPAPPSASATTQPPTIPSYPHPPPPPPSVPANTQPTTTPFYSQPIPVPFGDASNGARLEGLVSNTRPTGSPLVNIGPTLIPRTTPVTKVATMPKRPTYTRHLNETWGRDYEDRTKDLPTAQGALQVKRAQIQKFRVVLFKKSGEAHSTFTVTSCPSFPLWCFEHCPDTMKKISGCEIEFYDFKSGFWIECSATYLHHVETDKYLVLRRLGVDPFRFQEVLRAVSKVEPHYRFFASQERQSVAPARRRKAVKFYDDGSSDDSLPPASPTKKTRSISPAISIASSDSGSEIEIVSQSGPTRTIPVVIKEETPSLSVSPSLSTGDNNGAAPPGSFSTSTRASLDLSGPMSEERIPRKEWPYSMYTIDLAKGFAQMTEAKKKGMKFHERFSHVFGPNETEPKERKYQEHAQKWSLASETLRSASIQAGHTKDGEWRVFSRQVNVKKLRG